jgi:hypothetical protein
MYKVVRLIFLSLLLLSLPGRQTLAIQVATSPADTLPGQQTVLPPCDDGPDLLSVSQITDSSLLARFHGKNVFGLDYQILDASGVWREGSIVPASNLLPVSYARLLPGTYRLRLVGNTCRGASEKEFSIPLPANEPLARASRVPVRALTGNSTYELVMNLTGEGYEPAIVHGLHPDWVERIEAFRYDWGYGITGIRLCVRWYEWEPTPGAYTRAGLQKVIAYCRERGLKLSIFFWPWRLKGDGFIPPGHAMIGHRGSPFETEGNKQMGSLASAEVNQKLHVAVRELAKELSTYEGGYYMSIGTAEAEELTNPVVGLGTWQRPELVGFEPVFQEGFREYRTRKGQPFARPDIREWTGGCALDMSNELGKDFARYISLSLTRYFENFARAVRQGSNGKLLSVYMYPDAGSPQNAWYLHANFAAQAAAADGMYGTDGISRHDNDRKLLVNAINLGMGKVSINEYDPEDLGQNRGGPYCSGIDLDQMGRAFARSYAAGVQVVSFAMAFCPDEIRAMEPYLRPLWRQYIGKPYQRPNRPVTVVPIGRAFFKGEEIYMPYFKGTNFLRPDDGDFWGEGR